MNAVKGLLAVAITSAAIYWLISIVEFGELAQAFARVHAIPVALSFAIVLASVPLRARQWRLLLGEDDSGNRRSTFPAVCLGYLGDLLLPFRGGDVLRVVIVSQTNAMSPTEATPSLAIVRLQDLLPVATILALAMSVAASTLFQSLGIAGAHALYRSLLIAGAAGLLATTIVVSPSGRRAVASGFLVLSETLHKRPRWAAALARFRRGVVTAGNPRRFVEAQCLAAACWALFLASALPMLLAFGFTWREALLASLLQTGFATAALMLPTAPAGLGAYHAVCVACLLAVKPDLPAETALAYALVVHAIGTVGPALLGVLYLPANIAAAKHARANPSGGLAAEEAAL